MSRFKQQQQQNVTRHTKKEKTGLSKAHFFKTEIVPEKDLTVDLVDKRV